MARADRRACSTGWPMWCARGLNMDRETLPLARILQGGTWTAGRNIARQLRPDGGPPLKIVSDGTVF